MSVEEHIMAETSNLDLLLMEVGSPNREVLVNAGLTVLDSQTAGVLALDVAGSGDLTLTDTTTGQAKYGVLRLSGALTGARTVLVPDKGRRYLVQNATTGAFPLTVKTAAGSGVAVAQGTWADLVCDGTDVLPALTSTSGVTPGTPLSVARYAASGTALEAAPLTVDAQGNLRLGSVTPGTSAQRALVLPSGVAPTAAHPADAVQAWVTEPTNRAREDIVPSKQGAQPCRIRAREALTTVRARAGKDVTTQASLRSLSIQGGTVCHAPFTYDLPSLLSLMEHRVKDTSEKGEGRREAGDSPFPLHPSS